MPRGAAFGINGAAVIAPDEYNWEEHVIGTSLSASQKRSPWRVMRWTKQVAGADDVDGDSRDWFSYDNVTLSSITVPTYKGYLDDYSTYTRAVCMSVSVRRRKGVANQLTAEFWIDTGSVI